MLRIFNIFIIIKVCLEYNVLYFIKIYEIISIDDSNL